MPYANILDEREPLKKPILASVVLHAGIVTLLVVGSFLPGRTPQRWGDVESMGGSTVVNPVSRIPMVARSGMINRVANDTESQIPQAPPQPKAVEKAVEPEPNAIPIKGRETKKTSRVTANNDRYRPYTETKPNQAYSSTGSALVSPMIGTVGSGGVGIGKGTPLGDRFGAYAALLQQRIAQNWKTQDIDPRIHTAPPVIMLFTILRNGTIKDIKVKTSSGNLALDRSAERALYDVGRVEPLPPGYDRDEAVIEFWFELRR
jgi:periplasmic protein TonB